MAGPGQIVGRIRARRGRALAVAGSCLALAGCDALDLRPGAESVFELFSQPSTEEAARWALDKYDADRRYQGTLILANKPFAGEPVYMRLFTDNLEDPDPGVRAAAVRAIANHATPDQAPLVVARLADEDEGVRLEAAKGLQRLHNPAAIPALLGRLDPAKEGAHAVRAEAADALGQYPSPQVVDGLIRALADPRLVVKRRAEQSLSTLTGQDFGVDRRAWAQWLEGADAPFGARAFYVYPAYQRARLWYEYIPFWPKPPIEPRGTPAGMATVWSATSS